MCVIEDVFVLSLSLISDRTCWSEGCERGVNRAPMALELTCADATCRVVESWPVFFFSFPSLNHVLIDRAMAILSFSDMVLAWTLVINGLAILVNFDGNSKTSPQLRSRACLH